jgi:capsule biosynthesis phosphatase
MSLNKKNNKRIILDFDDTISFAKDRDWDNALPNLPLICKTNRLFDQGWNIDIYTARGSISCATRFEADTKYRSQIERWLQKHGVKYHELSFDKPLASFYVDDKGITPEKFLEIEISQLKGGLSGADIFSDGSSVHKTADNSHEVAKWLKYAANFIKVPTVERVVGNTISMQFIENDKDFFRNNHYLGLGLVQDTLEKMKRADFYIKSYSFKDYIERIKKHVAASGEKTFEPIISRLEEMKPMRQGFSHGDFGITNCLFCEKELYLIDPIPDCFGSSEIDSAKFCASLLINKYPIDIFNYSFNSLVQYNSIHAIDFTNLVLSEIIRVYKYHPDKNFILNLYKSLTS